jgi:hypothetical protein
MASHQYSHSSLGDYQIFAQASQVPTKIEAPTAFEPLPELSRGCDIILQHAQELKDEIVKERQRNKDCIQDLEQRLAECRAEISQLKATFTISTPAIARLFTPEYCLLSRSFFALLGFLNRTTRPYCSCSCVRRLYAQRFVWL